MSGFIVFMGAGASVPFGLPTMVEMAEGFEGELRTKHPEHMEFFNIIKSRLQDYKGFDIEALITVLQNIIEFDEAPARTLNHPSIHYILAERSGGIDKALEYEKQSAQRHFVAVAELLKGVKSYIANSCMVKQQAFDIYDVSCYLVGYSFRDGDILGLFQDSMELNTELQLYVLDPAAETIAEEKFKPFLSRVHLIPEKFSSKAAGNLA